ncbi:MAG: cytochrome c class [Planctomycetaceae bacterium]|nr:cytochrome c class [Planctomycetaceae bacterium]
MRVGVSYTVLLVVAWGAVGCSGPEAKFVTSEKTQALIPEAKAPIEKSLLDNFGTPHKLVAWQKLPVDYGKAEAENAGHEKAGWKLLNGRNLYMRHCLHCHGVSGDGNGPTANYLNPRPRDYRLGEFKFTSTANGIKARSDDLHLTLVNGIPGTSMPSFALLKPEELTALVDYVRWLAMRGEFEKKLGDELTADYSKKAVTDRTSNKEKPEKRTDIIAALDLLLKGTKEAPAEFPETIKSSADAMVAAWTGAEDASNQVIPAHPRQLPSADSDSISRGRKLYLSTELGCYTCHGLAGKGDGVSSVNYWPIPGSSPQKNYPERGLHDVWGNKVKPRNLTLGQYRGGRRPVDIYRRVFAGIKGTQMAGFATALNNNKDEDGKEVKNTDGSALNDAQVAALRDRKIWDIVNYVLDIPYQDQTVAPIMPKAPAAAPQTAAK